jgi:hypothetical protein
MKGDGGWTSVAALGRIEVARNGHRMYRWICRHPNRACRARSGGRRGQATRGRGEASSGHLRLPANWRLLKVAGQRAGVAYPARPGWPPGSSRMHSGGETSVAPRRASRNLQGSRR